MSTGAAVAAAARQAERRMVEHLREAGAVGPASACPLPDQRWIGTRVLRGLIAAGAVREADPGYYLDEASYSAHQARRNGHAVIILAVVALLATLVVLWATLR